MKTIKLHHEEFIYLFMHGLHLSLTLIGNNKVYILPIFSNPMANWISPVINVRSMAYVASSCTGDFSEANSAMRSDMMAVGPRVMSLAVPRKQYINTPINAEYSPYYKQIQTRICE